MPRSHLSLFLLLGAVACGSDLSGLKSETDYPYRVNLIFDLATDTSPECLPLATACQVRLKGNVTYSGGTRAVGAQVWAKAGTATTYSPLVVTNQSGIFNITIPIEKTANGRVITLCSGATLEIAVTGLCPTLSIQ